MWHACEEKCDTGLEVDFRALISSSFPKVSARENLEAGTVAVVVLDEHTASEHKHDLSIPTQTGPRRSF